MSERDYNKLNKDIKKSNMKKLFGAKKKEEPKPPAPSLGDTSSKVIKQSFIINRLLVGRKRQSYSIEN
jgi:hypothetical protein